MSKQRLLKIICIILSVTFIIEVSAVTLLFRPKARYLRNINLGNKYLLAEDYDQAVIAFSKAIKIDSMSAEAYIGRGKAYYALGDLEKVQADYALAAKLSGDDSIIREFFPDPTATPSPPPTAIPTSEPAPEFTHIDSLHPFIGITYDQLTASIPGYIDWSNGIQVFYKSSSDYELEGVYNQLTFTLVDNIVTRVYWEDNANETVPDFWRDNICSRTNNYDPVYDSVGDDSYVWPLEDGTAYYLETHEWPLSVGVFSEQ